MSAFPCSIIVRRSEAAWGRDMDNRRLETVLQHLRGLVPAGAASATDGELLERFVAISSVSFSPDGKSLISMANDKTVHEFDLATGKQLK